MLKKGDKVQVIAGKDKGKVGTVLKVIGTTGVLVEKVNLAKRHMKPTQKNPQGGIVEKERPVHYSNVLPFSEKHNRGVRYSVYKRALGEATKAKTAKAKK